MRSVGTIGRRSDHGYTDPLPAWIEAQVAGGHHESVEAYVGDLIRRDRLSLLDHQTLVDALVAGEESGISPRRVPDITADLKRELDDRRMDLRKHLRARSPQ